MSKDELESELVRLIEERKPESVKELANLIQDKFSISETKLVEFILELQNQGKLSLKSPPSPTPTKLAKYLKTRAVSWYWTTLILAATGTFTIFLIPENFLPISYARYILGTIMVLLLPGYSFTKALFPKSSHNKNLDFPELVALSIAFSIMLVAVIGLILNFTWEWTGGVRLTPIVFSLFTLTTVLSTVALVREHSIKNKQSKTHA